MVEGTCGSCGAVQQVDDADVAKGGGPACRSCGGAVAVASTDSIEIGLPDLELSGSEQPDASGGEDLPAPKGKSALDDLPAPKSKSALDDLPAPKTGSGLGDLPAPKGKSALDDLPAPKGKSALDDLPAPKTGNALDDLPAPKTGGGLGDLPAPKGKSAPGDLPAPKTGNALDDLPAPKTGSGLGDLPAPKGKSAPGDLPAPRAGDGNLPAPKGRGEGDLPTPRAGNSPPPADHGDDAELELGEADLLAPDEGAAEQAPLNLDGPLNLEVDDALELDDPAPASGAGDGAEPQESQEFIDLGDPLPDPGGPSGDAFGDSLDLEPSPAGGEPQEPFDLGDPLADGGLELGDPLPVSDAGGDGEPQESFDLGDPLPDPGGPSGDAPGDSLDLEPSPTAGGDPARDEEPAGPFGLSDGDLGLEGDGGGPAAAPLELETPSAGPSAPAAGGDGGDDDVVTFQAPRATPAPAPAASRRAPPGDEPLEVDAEHNPEAVAADKPHLRERREQRERAADEAARTRGKRRRIALAAVGAATVLGAGGFWGYTEWSARERRSAAIRRHIDAADRALADTGQGHWERAARAAGQALESAPDHAGALGMAAQAAFARALEEGRERPRRIEEGEALLGRARDASGRSPELAKAEALQAILRRRPGSAVDALSELVRSRPGDADAHLFLGWAHAANHSHAEAARAFERSLKQVPERVPALHGLGLSRLALGQRAKARESFLRVLELDTGHIGAQIGVAQLEPVDRLREREQNYLAILERKDIDEADPRSVARAWALAGDAALRAGRVDEAKVRYGRALERDPQSLRAHVGEGRAARASGRLDAARDALDQVLGVDGDHILGTIARAELAVAEGEPAQAVKLLARVLDRDPPIEDRRALTRAHMVRGRALSARDDAAGAEAAYREAAELSTDANIEPTVTLAQLLADQGRGDEAVALLEPIQAEAEGDPGLAVTLGVAYLRTGDAAAAETWFRSALEERPDDVEARFQLGLALLEQSGRTEAGLVAIERAHEAAPEREDIGVELALRYQEQGRIADARRIYDDILSGEPSINALARAGEFHAEQGNSERLRELGDAILAERPESAAGLYLRGEGRYAAGEHQDAVADFSAAVDRRESPQYLEALGRAREKVGELDGALLAYARALEENDRLLEARLGRARIHLARRDFELARKELTSARELAPEHPAIAAGIGESYLAVGDTRDAAEALARAVRQGAKSARTHYLLGRAYYDLDRPGSASRALGAAAQSAQGDEDWLAEAHRMLGYAQRSRGNRAGAIRAWRSYLEMQDGESAERRDVERLLMRLGGL